VIRFSPKRPWLIESTVLHMRAAKAGGMMRVGQVAKILIRSVTAARPAISVKLSRPYSQNCVFPPKPRSLIIESRKSSPCFSALMAICLLRSKEGRYCGAFSLISQPLLLMGTNTPTCMGQTSYNL
jgi:hypothetical protein